MSKNNNGYGLFSQMINFVISISLITVFATMVLLIYLPFSESIDDMFDPRPEQLTGNYGGGGEADTEKISNGIHVATGMIYDENFEIVRRACTSCHSAKLVTQNRATREGWKQMIRWMQKTQNLPDLGKDEGRILNYLAKNYAPEDEGRRKALNVEEIEWYTLNFE